MVQNAIKAVCYNKICQDNNEEKSKIVHSIRFLNICIKTKFRYSIRTSHTGLYNVICFIFTLLSGGYR